LARKSQQQNCDRCQRPNNVVHQVRVSNQSLERGLTE
jgi:hypothetical protein